MKDNIVKAAVLGLNEKDIIERYMRLKAEYHERDLNNNIIELTINNKVADLYPEAFSAEGSYRKLMVANNIEIASKAMADNLGILPDFTCSAKDMSKDTQQQRATDKTKIVNNYIQGSQLGQAAFSAAQKYAAFGTAIIRIEPDWANNRPHARFIDPRMTYFHKTIFNEVVAFYQKVELSYDYLVLQYPQFADKFKEVVGYSGATKLTIVAYHDKNFDALFCDGAGSSFMFDSAKNLMGKMMVNFAAVPGITTIPTGLYDSLPTPLIAKNQLAHDNLNLSRQMVNLPVVVPTDVESFQMGSNSVIQTDNPQGVRRLEAPNTNGMFQQQQYMDNEMAKQSRIPASYSGQSNASVITGAGVDAQNQPFTDTQVNTHRAQWASLYQWAASSMLEMDEVLFGDVKKNIDGKLQGAAYALDYTPRLTIKGDYTVQVAYQLAQGLSAAQWTVQGLQLLNQGVISADTLRRSSPFDLDAEMEEKKIMLEKLQSATEQSVMAMVQSMAQLAAAGQDIAPLVRQMAEFNKKIQKGTGYMTAFAEVFAPEPTPEELAAAEAAASPAPSDPAADMEAMMAGQTPQGIQGNGMLEGVAPGQAGQAPGGMGALASIASKLDSTGKATSSVGFREQRAV